MKIAFTICNIGFGHATRSLNVVRELDRRDHEIHVLIGKPYDQFFRKKGYNTITLTEPMNLYEGVGSSLVDTLKFSAESFPKGFLTFLKSRKELKGLQPDILISDSEPASLISVGGVKKVMLTHEPTLYLSKFSRLNDIWNKILHRCDKIIIPDVIDLEIPEKLDDISERIGPLFHKIEERKKELKDKLGYKGKTGLIIPSFASSKKSEIYKELEGMNHNLIFLGQDRNERMGNIVLKKREDVENPCEYIKMSDFVILSGYTSLMEAVYYQKPVLMIPTQHEQKKVAKKGERNGILKMGKFSRQDIKSFIEDKKSWKEMMNNQEKYHRSGAKEAADIIEKLKS